MRHIFNVRYGLLRNHPDEGASLRTFLNLILNKPRHEIGGENYLYDVPYVIDLHNSQKV